MSELSKSESLQLISEMINAAKREVKGNQFYFLFWGWLAIAIHAAHYYLGNYTDMAHPEMVWGAAALGGIFTAIHTSMRKKQQDMVSHFDVAIGYLWMAYGFTMIILIAATIKYRMPVYPTVSVLTALPTFITGVLVRYKPLIFCGSLFWIFGAIGFTLPQDQQIIISAVALVLGYLVPGYMIKYSK